jgi:surfeit locus 1 family protein
MTLRAGRLGLVLAGVCALAAFALLMSLGTWQMRRLAWKEDLITKIEARVQDPPVALPDESIWAALKPDDYEYRHVSLRGTFDHAKEIFVFRASGPNEGLSQPGYVVMTPLRLESGASLLVARGFVTEAFKDPAKRAQGQIEGPVNLSGVMRAPEPRNNFTPADSPEKALWYTRDPAAMAAALNLPRPAPFSIDADATPLPGGWPKAGVTVVSIRNDHLAYALTWYGLAATLVALVGFLIWRTRKTR